MRVIMFQPRFARLVESGSKRQTIRRNGKRNPKPGEMLSLREWSGKPYRSKQCHLMAAPCLNTFDVNIWEDYITVNDGAWLAKLLDETGCQLPNINLNDILAQRDGFKDWPEMREWFRKTHGLPFSGILIRW